MKYVPDKDILLFRSCLVSVEYPGVEASTKFVFDKLGIDYAISWEWIMQSQKNKHAVQDWVITPMYSIRLTQQQLEQGISE